MSERKYALTKIAAGDYLLPSNDAQTIWRIAKYKDGVAEGLDREHTFWGVWKYHATPQRGKYVDTDWTCWTMEESSLPTRADAIAAALRVGA